MTESIHTLAAELEQTLAPQPRTLVYTDKDGVRRARTVRVDKLVHVEASDEGLVLRHRDGLWAIATSIDPETDPLYADVLTETNYNSTCYYRGSDGPTHELKDARALVGDRPADLPQNYRQVPLVRAPLSHRFTGTSLRAHRDAVLRWVREFRDIELGIPQPKDFTNVEEHPYQDPEPDLDYDGWGNQPIPQL